MRHIGAISAVVLTFVMLFFWLVPHDRRNDIVTFAAIVIASLSAVTLAGVFHRPLRTWRGFGSVLIMHVLSQAWLLWQWDLWNSPIEQIRNLNVVVGLVAITTLVVLLASLVLLLIFRDASVIALAVAWLGWPILLIGTALRFQTLANLDHMPAREQLLWAVPTCLLSFLVLAGGVAFPAHLIWLGIKEIVGRELVGES